MKTTTSNELAEVDENGSRRISSPLAKGMSDREWIQGIVQMEIDYRLHRYQRNRSVVLAGFLVFVTLFLLPELLQFYVRVG